MQTVRKKDLGLRVLIWLMLVFYDCPLNMCVGLDLCNLQRIYIFRFNFWLSFHRLSGEWPYESEDSDRLLFSETLFQTIRAIGNESVPIQLTQC